MEGVGGSLGREVTFQLGLFCTNGCLRWVAGILFREEIPALPFEKSCWEKSISLVSYRLGDRDSHRKIHCKSQGTMFLPRKGFKGLCNMYRRFR